MSENGGRQRMLTVLRKYGRFDTDNPASVAAASLEELWDLRGFGAAATYECYDWLIENGLGHDEMARWFAARADNGLGDPRATRDPEDYDYDTKSQRTVYL